MVWSLGITHRSEELEFAAETCCLTNSTATSGPLLRTCSCSTDVFSAIDLGNNAQYKLIYIAS